MATQIENAFQRQFGFQSAVIIRTSAELLDILDTQRYKNQKDFDLCFYNA